MTAHLTFMMGEFAAEIATDCRYVRNHMWAKVDLPPIHRFGLSAYAVRLLQDVYFIEFNVEPGDTIKLRQEIGMIESKKAESGIYAPCAGVFHQINPRVLADPSIINVDKYGEGWLFAIEPQTIELLTPEAYLKHLDSAWDVAQRTIKGQANTE